jgi:hypothetical protein
MRNIKCLIILLMFVCWFPAKLMAEDVEPLDVEPLGEELLRQLWQDFKERDVSALEKMMVPGFQSIHQDRAGDRASELALIKGLHLSDFTLSNIVVTENENVLVVTYLVSVAETIEGRRLNREPASRLTVFVKSEEGWKWLAHANLKPFGQVEK